MYWNNLVLKIKIIYPNPGLVYDKIQFVKMNIFLDFHSYWFFNFRFNILFLTAK
jgi:hypothetical protein